MTTKTKKRTPDEVPAKAKVKAEVSEEERPSNDRRPVHLASAVLASYQARTGHEVGTPFQGATIAGGTGFEPKAICINGTETRSLWRVQCYVEWDDPSTGLHRYSPKPTACVYADDAGQIVEVCKP